MPDLTVAISEKLKSSVSLNIISMLILIFKLLLTANGIISLLKILEKEKVTNLIFVICKRMKVAIKLEWNLMFIRLMKINKNKHIYGREEERM